MDLLKETLALAQQAEVTPDDIRSLGLTWRWYLKVRSGKTANPGVNHVEALNKLAREKLTKGNAAGVAA